MDEFYFSVALDNERTLCLAPLTNRWLEASGQQVLDQSGYFLFEKHSTGDYAAIEIIAQVFSEEAALMLREKFNMD